MIIVKMSGGLGNQMFQYALYRKFEHFGKEVKLGISAYPEKNAFRKFSLDIFGLSYRTANLQECRRLGECSYQPMDKIRRKVFGPKKSYYMENLDKGYQPEIFEMDSVYLDGYWQCERYFKDIQKRILEDFTFPGRLSDKSSELLEKIEHTESVSLHVRRGDYLNEATYKIYGNICTVEYYRNAILEMTALCKKPEFYLFSNDPEWAEETFGEMERMRIVKPGEERPDYEDMFLMSRCKHNVIANSSFSWWAAWLNQNANKKVLAPEKWFNNHLVTDVICDDWIRIKG